MRAGPERRHGWPLLLLAILPCMLLPAGADAQYFGRNKVQYKNFDFHERAWFQGGDREPLRSAGAGLRFNLLGFALAEVYWVKPFDRPLRNGYLTFSLNSGF